MATVRSFTSERMLQIENTTVVDGDVVGDNLILKTREGTSIDAGNVRGPTGSPGITSPEMAALLSAHMPPGTIVDYVNTTPPASWLAMAGQVVANGQALYPALWAVLPAGMKASPPNINFPDTRGKVSVGLNTADTDFDTPGKPGGLKTHTLAITNLPSHQHTSPDHQHTGPLHAHTQAHIHNEPGVYFGSQAVMGQQGSIGAGTGNFYIGMRVGQYDPEIDTFLSVPIGQPTNTNTGNSGTAVTGGSPGLSTGLVGSATPISIVQPYVTFLKIIKAI